MRPDLAEQEFLHTYDAHADALFRHCYLRVYDRERAKELVQEVFTRTWEYLADGKKIEYMRAFLYRVANNLLIDEAAQRARKPTSSLDLLVEEGVDPSAPAAIEQSSERRALERLMQKEEASEVHRALENVPEPYRTAVIMRYLDGLPPREIAEVLGENVNVISVRIHRGTAQLKKYLSYVSLE